MSAQRKFNDDKELKDWFRTYYIKWMETCDNLRWVSSGRGEKHPQALLPFIPFGYVPGLPYAEVLTRLIDVLFGRIPDQTADPLGNPAHMASIIVDPDTDVRPYILVEYVYGGVVQEHRLFRDSTWSDVEHALSRSKHFSPGKPIYKKTVKTAFLRKMYELHQQWLVHGNNARYLIDFLFNILRALRDGEATFEPEMPILSNLRSILRQIRFHSQGMEEEARDLAIRFSSQVPNLLIRTRGEEVPIDLGGKRTISISDEAMFALLDGLKLHATLAGLTDYLLELTERGLSCGWFKISGLEWLSRTSIWWFKPRVRALSGKMRLLCKIMANPYRIAMIFGTRKILITVKEGGLESIEVDDLRTAREPTLRDQWLSLCNQHGFVHLAITLRRDPQSKHWTLRAPGDFSILQRIDFFPNSDFIRFILRKGPLQLFFNVLMPFLSA